jgi:hypothetical protein
MTGAEVGTFLGSRSTNGAVFDRSDPRTTTAPQPSPIMKPVRTRWKGSGPVFNGSVDSWVALANPVPRVQRESAFHKNPGLFRAGNESRSPVLEFPLLARPASSSTGFVRIPRKGLALCRRRNMQPAVPFWIDSPNCETPPHMPVWNGCRDCGLPELPSMRDRWFESVSLQQRVYL